jgi:hypothetical protein
LEALRERIVSEWLYHRQHIKEVELFNRYIKSGAAKSKSGRKAVVLRLII